MKKFILVIPIFVLAALACNSVLPQTQPAPTPQPLTEADVPRISIEDAKAAVDSGEAVILDVRSAEAFAIGHIAGALSVPLAEIETDPAGLALDQDQWIITYCT